ncbi:MAG: hypothetical protein WCI92_19190 [Bacteroidota bacterium]
MNTRLVCQGDTTTLSSFTATLPEVSTCSYLFNVGNLAAVSLIYSSNHNSGPAGLTFRASELPDAFVFRSSKQILSRDFTGCEVLTGFTPSTITSAPGLYPMLAGVNKLLLS